jgi:hypothetical protein
VGFLFYIQIFTSGERVKWSESELAEVKLYFNSYFTGKAKRKCPGMAECQEAIKRSNLNNGTLCQRKWDTVKKKVSYMMHCYNK